MQSSDIQQVLKKNKFFKTRGITGKSNSICYKKKKVEQKDRDFVFFGPPTGDKNSKGHF